VDGDEDLVQSSIDPDENEAHVGKGNDRKDKKAKGCRLKAIAVSRQDVVSDEEDIDDEGLELPDSDYEGEGGHTFKSLEMRTWNILHFQLDWYSLRGRSLEKPLMSVLSGTELT
jgi:hypothetical protein